MTAIQRVLFHKEWQERKTFFTVGLGWMVFWTGYVFLYELTHQFRDPMARFYSVCSLYALVAAIFLAMKISLGERTAGTFSFSQSLPVGQRRLGWTRVLGGLTTLMVPIIAGALLMTAGLFGGVMEQALERPPNYSGIRLTERDSMTTLAAVGMIWSVAVLAIASGVQLVAILSLVGTRCRRESSVGFFGAVLAFAWLLSVGLRPMLKLPAAQAGWLGAAFPASLAISYGYGNEHGVYADLDFGQPFWLPLVLNLLLSAAIGARFVSGHATRKKIDGQMQRAKRTWWRISPSSWWMPRLRRPVLALVWLTLRQSVPLAVAGLALAVLITIAVTASVSVGRGLLNSTVARLASNTWYVAIIWAAMTGSGIFAAELQPRLAHFWRSRPIPVRQWYWVKFVVGLIAVLAVLDGVTIAVGWHAADPVMYGRDRLSLAYIACMPVLHAAMFSIAVLCTFLFRRAAIGTVGAIALFGVFGVIVGIVPRRQSLEPIDVYNRMFDLEVSGEFTLLDPYYLGVYGVIAAVTIAAAAAGRRIATRSEIVRHS